MFLFCFFISTSAYGSNRRFKSTVTLSGCYIERHSLKKEEQYIVNKRINLRGKTLIIPENCCIFFKNGGFRNGKICFQNTLLKGKVDLRCRVSGTVQNDTVLVRWFNYTDHSLVSMKKRRIAGAE